MTFLQWMAILGTLLLILALASAYLRWLPVTTSVAYLLFGIAIGPLGLGLWKVDFREIAVWMEHLTEVAVLVSLFVGGLKLRLPLRDPAWLGAYALAGPVMLACIAGVALFGHYLLGLDLGLALLLGAMLAPTDPVLASLVQVSHAKDLDRVRYALSGEAGFNDGVAFPFVMLALLYIQHDRQFGGWVSGWAAHDLLWAIPAGLLVGYLLGHAVGRLAIYLRARHVDTSMSANDFLALALIALSYVCAELVGGLGFVATFTAGVGLRHAEILSFGRTRPLEDFAQHSGPRITGDSPELSDADMNKPDVEPTKIAAGVMMDDILSFGDLLERALEVLLVTLLGVTLMHHWDWRALPLALALFCVIRPLSVFLLVGRRHLTWRQRGLLGWFGIRGIGSLYYLSFAVSHGLPNESAKDAIGLTLSVVALSILMHGATTQPLLDWYERRIAARKAAARADDATEKPAASKP
jgi:NhaP-type Na+/H+ or K+/H+ antiporter